VDNEIRDFALKFRRKSEGGRQAVLLLASNPTRMHIVTHLSDKYEKCVLGDGWSEEEQHGAA